MASVLYQSIETLSRDKGIEPAIVVGAVEDAIALATRKYYKTQENMRAEMDTETGEIRAYVFKTVVEGPEQVEDEINQLTLEQARELAPEVEVGGELRFYKDTSPLGRIAAQMAKQVIFQKVREAERDTVFLEYNHRAGEVLNATVKRLAFACLSERLPCPADMKPDAYQRNLTARAFDVARYLLFWGVPTNVGQVVSIRTLEKQIRRLKASEYAELRQLGGEIAQACAAEPDCRWDPAAAAEPLAPTLARHAGADEHAVRSRDDLRQWAAQNLPPAAHSSADAGRVDLVRPTNVPADVAATLLYPVTDRPFRELYEMTCGWSDRRRAEVIDVALASRTRRDEILGGFRGGLYAFDMVIDVGAYRDLHRHRRCQKFRQAYSGLLGFETPALVADAAAGAVYETAMRQAFERMAGLPAPGAHYLLPFGARSRFLFKMDFAEAEYMSRLRSGVKGHFSYREVAWQMKQKMEALEPELGRLIDATPPWVEDPLKR